MFTMQEMDEHVSHADQFQDNSSEPITLLNTFQVAPHQVDDFIAEWGNIVREFRTQPGQISTQVYRGIAGSGMVVIQAVWESVAHYRAAVSNPAFQQRVANYPSSTVAMPHLYRKVAVPNVCVA
jgi:quinol monooxygenase YgiN